MVSITSQLPLKPHYKRPEIACQQKPSRTGQGKMKAKIMATLGVERSTYFIIARSKIYPANRGPPVPVAALPHTSRRLHLISSKRDGV